MHENLIDLISVFLILSSSVCLKLLGKINFHGLNYAIFLFVQASAKVVPFIHGV